MDNNLNPFIDNSLHVFENVNITHPLTMSMGNQHKLVSQLRQLADDIESGVISHMTHSVVSVKNGNEVTMTLANYCADQPQSHCGYDLKLIMDEDADAVTLLTSLFIDTTPSVIGYPDGTIQINLEPAGLIDDVDDIPVITIIPRGSVND